jgi:hypothetical protein
LWLHAWDSPWGCVRGGILRVLRTSDVCAGCSNWQSREQVPSIADGKCPAAPRTDVRH